MSYTVKIVHDDNVFCPRSWDNFGTMACWHSRYNLGDTQPSEDPQEYIDALPDGCEILPLYLYDHSGITMRTSEFSCAWDSGQVGIIYVTPERIKAEYGADTPEIRVKARAVLKSEVKTYDQYLTGDVWGFQLYENKECACCGYTEQELIDSCYGFFGECLDDMKENVDPAHHEAFDLAWKIRF